MNKGSGEGQGDDQLCTGPGTGMVKNGTATAGSKVKGSRSGTGKSRSGSSTPPKSPPPLPPPKPNMELLNAIAAQNGGSYSHPPEAELDQGQRKEELIGTGSGGTAFLMDVPDDYQIWPVPEPVVVKTSGAGLGESDAQIQGSDQQSSGLESAKDKDKDKEKELKEKEKDKDSLLDPTIDAAAAAAQSVKGSLAGISIGGSSIQTLLRTRVDIPDGFQDAVLGLLNCTNCNEVAFPPIFNCKNGHLACSSCRKNNKNCKECRAGFKKKRNAYMESIAVLLKHKCSHKLCPQVFEGRLVSAHKLTCEYRPIECAERNVKVCQGNLVNFEDYEEHLRTVHVCKVGELKCAEDSFCCDFAFANWKNAKFDSCVLKFEGKAFILQLRRIAESDFCFTVSLIGCEADATEYIATIRVEKPKEQFPALQWTGRVHSVHTSGNALRNDFFQVSTRVATPFCQEIWGAKGKRVEYRLAVSCRLENRSTRDTVQ